MPLKRKPLCVSTEVSHNGLAMRITTIALIAILFPVQAPCRTCICDEPSADIALKEASAVFIGRAIDAGDACIPHADGSCSVGRQYRFEISRAWKGTPKKDAIVFTWTSCMTSFTLDHEYVVFATGPMDSLRTGQCYGNTLLDSASALVSFLDHNREP